jgi:uncharacterized membrane protein (UPF0136 family)
MFTSRGFLTIVSLASLSLARLCSLGFAQGESSVSLSSGVVADLGQTAALYLILDSPDSVAGLDMLVEFDQVLLTSSPPQFLTRFQYITYDNSVPGRLRIVARRHHSDSAYLAALPPGTDTLGFIWFDVTSQDLVMDIQTPVVFYDDPVTPFSDNRLVKSDSSFVTPPELSLSDGGFFIRYPLYGDVNDDQYAYTIADAIFFFNFLAGGQKLTPRQRANSDVNKDGMQASMSDFIQLIKVIAEE